MKRAVRGGWVRGARRRPSPNHDRRPAGSRIELIVIHGISLPAGAFGSNNVVRLFRNDPPLPSLRDLRVSAHFLIERDGGLLQFVSCDRRAWHAGVSRWRERPACNDYSIGIELSGCDQRRYDRRQYRALIALIKQLRGAYPLAAVAGHCHIAPGRKTDPGPRFDWELLFRRIGRQYDGRA